MTPEAWISLLLISPFAGFLVNSWRFRNPDAVRAGSIGTFACVLSFIATLGLWTEILKPGSDSLHWVPMPWIDIPGFRAEFGFLVDRISIIMLSIITGVGSLIHLFSMGYMSHDERPAKYFAYLNLFLFNMLLLVLADNLLVMFVGWEGVGLCSYLLIGFWFKDAEKASAGMKAFLANRVGDAGFLLGMFMLVLTFGSLNYHDILASLPLVPETSWSGPITLACLFLFIGATGKSAQIPLYVWLPDAMAGPTPVSALIHAATMVTAGVYMTVRLSGLFVLAPHVLGLIAMIGVATAFFAATIGMNQWDIKKILAYSTVSQLGFMFIAVGVGAFIPALFHLMTHAFFKALMFLGSGSVIHALDGEQDVRKMGGLSQSMPVTHITFVAGWLAIIGIPPLAGFFSKDEILWYAYISPFGSKGLWALTLIAAMMTAFYMTRLMCLVFWGASRVPKNLHPHEGSWHLTLPLIVLGLLSVVGGWVGIPHVLGHDLHLPHVLEDWLHSSVFMPHITGHHETAELILMFMSVCLASLMAYTAYYIYIVQPNLSDWLPRRFPRLDWLVQNKYFVDELYFARIIGPIVKASEAAWEHIDANFIDQFSYKISDLVVSTGRALKYLQSGNLQTYAMYIAIGLAAAATFSVVSLGVGGGY